MRRIAEFQTKGLAPAARRAGRLIFGFLVMLACLEVGGALAPLLPVRLPGALMGMVVLAALLTAHRGRVAVAASEAGTLLMRRYALFFVPAGVGVMTSFGPLRGAWPAVVTALIVSSLLALVVTGLTMQLVLGLQARSRRAVLQVVCGHE
ncbi:CidA/LrgA family protein [Acidiphilium sp. C61]|jgi:holin-like protein|uniref:CidA/LrgA family protein n=1 Tax=Acidiphilium sp. C61 TaxID=1671485 RepID=UPI00157A6D2E|nr:CidA/LrgA family protein [Acidiphilium sp. C61]